MVAWLPGGLQDFRFPGCRVIAAAAADPLGDGTAGTELYPNNTIRQLNIDGHLHSSINTNPWVATNADFIIFNDYHCTTA